MWCVTTRRRRQAPEFVVPPRRIEFRVINYCKTNDVRERHENGSSPPTAVRVDRRRRNRV